jgi:hypothetical protein
MTTISESLMDKARELRASLSVEGDGSWDLVKSAAIESLKGQGITDAEKVLEELSKRAGFKETRSVTNSFSFNPEEVVLLIEKIAEYVDELEVKIESREDTITSLKSDLEKAASVDTNDLVNALIEKGFSEEDASNLVALPKETLNKVASMAKGEPWEMGKGARPSADGMDAFTKFLIS